jgi:Undecaprenyl-phosphate galactose phosphotransferase WbaP
MTLADFDMWYRSRYGRTTSAFIALSMVFSDIIAVLLSFGTGFFLVNWYDLSVINFKSFVTYWPYVPVFILIFQMMFLYPGIALAPAEEFRRFTVSSVIGHGGIVISRYIEDQDWDAISVAFLISLLFSTVILLICRDITHSGLRRTKFGGIPAVVYGGGDTEALIIDRLLQSKRIGYTPVVILDGNPGREEFYRGIPVISDTSLGPELVQRYNIKMAIIAVPDLPRRELAKLLNGPVSAFRYNVLIPQFFGATNIWMSVRDFDGVLGFVTSHRLNMFWNTGIKRLADLALVIVGGLLVLPLLLFIALLVKFSSPGPVLYGHRRLGRNGRPFRAYKFRSMVNDAGERLQKLLAADPKLREEWEASHKLKEDPRITGIGKVLRRISFDEFPQLINVLRGEMSLVGPRPIVEDEVVKYGEDYHRIFSVRPGLTGLWQVSGRSDRDYAGRVALDTYYLQSWSLWLDLWILYKTFGVVLRGKGAY